MHSRVGPTGSGAGGSSRTSLIHQLSVAAEIEHGITCQYLFAAFSIKTYVGEGGVDIPQLERLRHFKAELLSIAREEMGHHGLVLNMLNAIGGAPNFRRPPFPSPSNFTPPYRTHELLPFGLEVLERFACYEKLHHPSPEKPESPGTIGDLYQSICNGLEWVDQDNPNLFIGSTDDQITHEELKIREGQFDVHLAKIADLRSAQRALDSILEHDHWGRVVAIQRELETMLEHDPTLIPSRAVVTNPTLGEVPGGSRLEHPIARHAAGLFNDAYELMILLLDYLYSGTSEAPQSLVEVAFFPLMTAVIRPLGEMLTDLPAFSDEAPERAGAGFELHFDLSLSSKTSTANILAHERLRALAQSCRDLIETLQGLDVPWCTQALIKRFSFLGDNLERLAWNFERYTNLRPLYLQHSLRRLRSLSGGD